MAPKTIGVADSEITKQVRKIEHDHLRTRTLFVNIILLLLIFPITSVLYLVEVALLDIVVYFLVFTFIIAINSSFYIYSHLLPNIKLSMYITTLGVYLLSVSLVLDIQSSSIFTVLFLSYAIISIYHDLKVAVMNSILLLVSGIFIVSQFPDIFEIAHTLSPSALYILAFLTIFVALLSISSFVLIKRKLHFYRQVAQIKEQEFKHMDIFFDLQEKYSGSKQNVDEYYNHLESFSKALSKAIGVENVFHERIRLLRQLKDSKEATLLNKYPDYNKADLEELKQLELSIYNKISFTALKAAQIERIQLKKKELLTEKNQPSLNQREDDLETKIIAFAVFYALLRIDKAFFRALSHKQIVKTIQSEEVRHLVDDKILDIFLKNDAEFDKATRDIALSRVKS